MKQAFFPMKSNIQSDIIRARLLRFNSNWARANTYDAFARANGTSVRCVKEEPTSLNNISAENNRTIIGFFNILGQKLPQEPQSGMYIVIFDNGSSEKRMR
jgi:hypothetical protein